LELICLEMLEYNLNDLCSFSLLKLILQNGIALESENSANSDLDSKLGKIYENILTMNSMFLVDKRFVDFNALEIAFSLISYNTELFRIDSWRNNIAKIYMKRHKIRIYTCLFVIRR